MTNKTETSVFSNKLRLPQFTIVKFEIETRVDTFTLGKKYSILYILSYPGNLWISNTYSHNLWLLNNSLVSQVTVLFKTEDF